MLFLTEPGPQYKESFLQGLAEFQDEGRMLEYNIESVRRDFHSFIQHLQFKKDRSRIPPYLVPSTDYWLINGNEAGGIYLGTFTLRHELNEMLLRIGGHIGYQIRPSMRLHGYGRELLRLGLQIARQAGLRYVLVTCDEKNIGSRKIIEYNGGQLENCVPVEGSTIPKLRYWIDLC